MFLTFNDTNISAECVERAQAEQLYKLLSMIIILPICAIGMVANVVSVWVWNINKKHNPAMLLFQIQGVMDTIYLLLTLISEAIKIKLTIFYKPVMYILPAIYFSQSSSLHCTVVIGVIRWLAIARPHRMKSVSQRHVLLICAAVGGWCLLMGSLVLVKVMTFEPKERGYLIMDAVLEVVMFVVPTLILVGFCIALIVIAYQQTHSKQIKKGRLGLTMAVLSIAVSSILAFNVGMLALFWGVIYPDRSDQGCNWVCVVTGYAVAIILFAFNASNKFVFYLIFASNFRFYLKVTFRCQADSTKTSESIRTTRSIRVQPQGQEPSSIVP